MRLSLRITNYSWPGSASALGPSSRRWCALPGAYVDGEPGYGAQERPPSTPRAAYGLAKLGEE
jgi:hypothetical protein